MILEQIKIGVVAIGAAGAGAVLWNITALRRVRWGIAALILYAEASFVYALLTAISLRAAIAGNGLLPMIPWILQGTFIGALVVLPIAWFISVARAGIPALRGGSSGTALSQALALTLSVVLVAVSYPYDRSSLPTASQMTRQQRAAVLDNSLRAIEDGERNSPRDRWDPEYVVNMVGRDPQRLFAWVHDNTFWIPYRGELRGPVGVLMDRQGNSLDRALLLAALLEKAGSTVRLAHSDLKREQARALLSEFTSRRSLAFAGPQSFLPSSVDIRLASAQYQLNDAAASETLKQQEDALTAISKQLHDRVSDQSVRLIKAVAKTDPMKEWSARFNAAMAAVGDHWWVQAQDGQKWIDFDLFSENSGPIAKATDTHTPADLAVAPLHQEVAVRVVTEQWSEGVLTERTALEHVLRPADLIGQSIMLQFWPADWFDVTKTGSSAARGWHEIALDQHEWGAALLVGKESVEAKSLIDSGDDPDASKTQDAYGGGPMGGVGAGLDDALGNRRKKQNEPAGNKTLSAVWLEYEIRIPGEKPRIIRRAVFDLLGPAARVSSLPKLVMDDEKRISRSLALNMRTEILPVASQLAPEFVSHLVAQTLLGNSELLSAAAHGQLPLAIATVDQLIDRSAPALNSLYSLALARLEWSSDKQRIFIDRPNLLTTHYYPVVKGKDLAFRNATDIVANEIGVALDAQDAFAVRVAQGVLDTNAEYLLQTAATSFGNSGEAYAASYNWVTLAPGSNSSSTSQLNLTDDIKRQITQDVAAGFAVVAPQAAVSMPHQDFSGWWRINPVTGDSLGMGESGWGQELEENSDDVSRSVRIGRYFKNFGKRFASVFATNYGWCVAPLISKEVENGGMRLGPLQAAMTSSVDACVGDSIFIGLVGALTLPLVALTLRGFRGPRAPIEPTPKIEFGPNPVDPFAETVPGRPGAKPQSPHDTVPNQPEQSAPNGNDTQPYPQKPPQRSGDTKPYPPESREQQNKPCGNDTEQDISDTGVDMNGDTDAAPSNTENDPNARPPEPEAQPPKPVPQSLDEAIYNEHMAELTEQEAKAAAQQSMKDVFDYREKTARYKNVDGEMVPNPDSTWEKTVDDALLDRANEEGKAWNESIKDLKKAQRNLKDAKANARGAQGKGGFPTPQKAGAANCVGNNADPQAQIIAGAEAANNAIAGGGK